MFSFEFNEPLGLMLLWTGWEWFFWCLYTYRFLRLFINTAAHWLYRSKPKPAKPTLSSSDVTVIVPTIENDVEELRAPLNSILACEPFELMLVTTIDRLKTLQTFAKSLGDSRVKVYAENIANKRLQLCVAIPEVRTDITILVDDDVTWPKTILPWLLAPLEGAIGDVANGEKKGIGAVGPCQKVRRLPGASLAAKCWNWLGCCYIERRNFEISATHFMDGGTSCMSGRTCAFRSVILKDVNFLKGFCEEKWGKYQLNADDDNFITRWLVNHGWDTWIQYNDECMIETTLENNPKFLAQCLRWARSNWRSNWTSLFVERTVWYRQPWSVYLIYFATFSSLGLFTDPLFFFSYHLASQTWKESSRHWGWMIVGAVYIFSKVIKLVGLFRRNIWDIFFLPVTIAFGLFHGLIKIYALYTWNVTSWGSRPDGDINDDERMRRGVVPAEVMKNPAAGSSGLIRYKDEKPCDSEKDSLGESSDSEDDVPDEGRFQSNKHGNTRVEDQSREGKTVPLKPSAWKSGVGTSVSPWN